MKRRLVLLLVVVAAVGIYVGYRVRRAAAPFEWSGTVEAHMIEVGSRVGGRVQEVSVREGDAVKAGQTLVTLEKGDLPAQRTIALGQLEQAQGALEKVASRTLPTARRAEIAEAQARLQVEQAQQEKAKLDDDRSRQLYKQGAVTRVDADNATLALKSANAQASALRSQLDTLLHGTPEDVRSGRGLVDAAQGRLQQIDVMLDELVIRAPRASRVESLDLRPGDILAPNAPAAKLLEPAELYVRIYVPETEIGHVHPGLEVPITVDSFPGKAFRGRVESVASEGEFTPRNLQTADERADQVFACRVRIEEGADVLRAGMAATVRVPR
ncbi:MAG TPA: HlyD family efflux transporter periplasmic adaptor subunit [Polyangia bacterium]|nr:HlyD family efflux transporter periplasmic adaptor subunit [Polyangia bacterium]